MKFPYRRALASSPAGLTYIYRPLVPLLIIGPQGSDLLLAVADTGSDDILLPRALLPHLGVTVDDSRAATLTSITGHQLMMSPGAVELELTDGVETCCWSATVYFVSYPDPLYQTAIFGHSGGLAFFQATFAGAQKEPELVPSSFPGTVRRP